MNLFKQYIALLQMNLQGLRHRWGTLLVTMIGTTTTVAVLISMLSMGVGARDLIMHNAREDRAWILSQGAQGAFDSSIPRDAARSIADMPGIKKDVDSRPIQSSNVIVIVDGHKKIDDRRVNFALVGVTAQYFALTPEFRLTAGRLFQPGLRELVVGKNRHTLFKNLELGDHLQLRGSEWTVVGHFETGNSADDTLMADADTVMSAYSSTTFNSVTVRLDSPRSFEALSAAVKANPNVRLDIKRETALFQEGSKQLTRVMDFVSYFVGSVMALGATLGAINALYAIVDSRRRDIATLRALGFSSAPVVVAVITESLLLTLPGSILGTSIAWLMFNGHAITPFGMSFTLTVTPPLIALGIGWALIMGLFGGLLPALRAARVPVTAALRAS